ncbi:hypothetical protein PGB90_008864 [Kerria lacca]
MNPYSNFSLPYPVNPNIPNFGSNIPISPRNQLKGAALHSLDGIPFKLSPSLQTSFLLDQNSFLEDVKCTLDRVKNMLNSNDFSYDCTLERNVLREHKNK